MTPRRLALIAFVASVTLAALPKPTEAEPTLPSEARRGINGTIWVANRETDIVRGFDAATGRFVRDIHLTSDSGAKASDLTYARGKLYVSEELGTNPSVTIVDPSRPAGSEILLRISSARPHHMHSSDVIHRDLGHEGILPCSYSTTLVAYGVYSTYRVGVIDARTDKKLGEWVTSKNSAARSHAGVFGPPTPAGNLTLYVANDTTNELSAIDPWDGSPKWTSPEDGTLKPLNVPAAHELVVSRDGKTAYVSGRSASVIHVVDLETPDRIGKIIFTDPLSPDGAPLSLLPDTLQLTAHERMLTVGLRVLPAKIAVIDLAEALAGNYDRVTYEIVTIGGANTLAGHQWTSPDGHYTFAAFEGPNAGVAVIDHRRNNEVVERLPFPGKPHGVTFAPSGEGRDGAGDGCGLS